MDCISQGLGGTRRPAERRNGQPDNHATHMPRAAKNCISHPNRFCMNPSSPRTIESHSKDPGHQSTAGN
jgi:hypothetical protein